jgi:hypothetical protein
LGHLFKLLFCHLSPTPQTGFHTKLTQLVVKWSASDCTVAKAAVRSERIEHPNVTRQASLGGRSSGKGIHHLTQHRCILAAASVKLFSSVLSEKL